MNRGASQPIGLQSQATECGFSSKDAARRAFSAKAALSVSRNRAMNSGERLSGRGPVYFLCNLAKKYIICSGSTENFQSSLKQKNSCNFNRLRIFQKGIETER